MIRDGEYMVPFHIQNWFDCGKPETLLSTNAYILKRDFSETGTGNFETSKIIPPVFIGKNCVIENSEVGPNVTIGEEVTIKNSKVINSLVSDKVVIENAESDEIIIGANEKISGNHKKMIKADGMEVNF